MKLESIGISHMHQIKGSVTYNLNDVTYFIGQNGAGKSTILQAIQLALLGYIPGYDKTNAGIMKHSSDGLELSVTATFDGDASITRTWKKDKSSVKSTVSAVPEGFDPMSLMGEIELPIFNFGEFKDMTANKLKEWFISFLPKEEFEIDWREYLTGELGSRAALLPEDYLEETLNYILEDLSTYQGVDLVKQINAHFKEEQSFQKATAERLQSTLNSMIYYQDVEEIDDEELRLELANVTDLKDKLIAYNTKKAYIDQLDARLAQIKLSVDSLEEDPEYKSVHATLISEESEYNKLTEKKSALSLQYSQLQSEYKSLSVTSDICPYTHTRCEKIAESIQVTQSKKAALETQIAELHKSLQEALEKAAAVHQHIQLLKSHETELAQKYSTYKSLIMQYPSEPLVIPTSSSVESLQHRINELNDLIAKVKANQQFNELNKTITADKYKAENILEVLKIWTKSTDANGLQTYMMEKPFKTLADDMSKYLSNMFGAESVASFHLEEKANSFSFGMMKDKSYVEFDLLSSGEKCLFIIAMMMCLIDRSTASLKLILADDILDHLDSDNAARLFGNLLKINNMQFIMAGVKECKNENICIKIGA